MGSKSSKEKRPIPAKPETVVILRIPQEIIDEILDYLAADSDIVSLQSCALVSRSWVPSCQRHLFHTIHFTPSATVGWSRTFRVPEESPAHYVRDLCVSTGSPDHLFFKHTPWFTNVERMTLLGDGGWILACWRLPQSITSLTIRTDTYNLEQVRGIMAQLPNLDDLLLSGAFVPVDRVKLVGIGPVLRGRFGGRLQLLNGYADHDVVNMLLEIPTGLRFTEVGVRGMYGCLPSTVRLAKACCKTLIKLSYKASSQYGHGAFERSFDFSEFPNLQEVAFAVGWMDGSLAWIPRALSTIKPATSPRLSVIQLNFSRPIIATRSVDALITDTSDDLRWVADEIARIEGEFEGAVDLAVHCDSSFRVVLDALNILQP